MSVSLKNKKGQTAVEYIILLAVIMVIMFPLLAYIRTQLAPERTPCLPNDRSIGCGVQRFISSMGANPKFKYFTLRR